MAASFQLSAQCWKQFWGRSGSSGLLTWNADLWGCWWHSRTWTRKICSRGKMETHHQLAAFMYMPASFLMWTYIGYWHLWLDSTFKFTLLQGRNRIEPPIELHASTAMQKQRDVMLKSELLLTVQCKEWYWYSQIQDEGLLHYRSQKKEIWGIK